MKKNKLTIKAFEKFSLTNANKINFKGGYPEGWTGELTIDGETWEIEGDDPQNGTGGPGTSTLSTGVIRPSVPIGTSTSTETGVKVVFP